MGEEYIIQNKFTGGYVWLFMWIIVFWPMAIIYYIYKKQPVKVKVVGYE